MATRTRAVSSVPPHVTEDGEDGEEGGGGSVRSKTEALL